jgi:hypothetical protein
MNRDLIFKKIILISSSLFLSINHLNAQVYNGTKLVPGHSFSEKDKNINWEAYDSTSIVTTDKIELKDIQGLWKAYKRVFLYKDEVRRIEISKPYIFEVKGNKARRDSYDSFIPFSLRKNFIVMIDDNKMVAGIINKINPKELTITWKDELNFKYDRCYYTKK